MHRKDISDKLGKSLIDQEVSICSYDYQEFEGMDFIFDNILSRWWKGQFGNGFLNFLMFLLPACMHVCVYVYCTCVLYMSVCCVRYIEASLSLWNYSSASTFMWVLDIELRSPGLCAKCLIHWVTITAFVIILIIINYRLVISKRPNILRRLRMTTQFFIETLINCKESIVLQL